MLAHSPRAIVLGVHSFVDEGAKVGSQYIAQGFARRGWKVDYVSIPSSLFDMVGSHRRNRLLRVWGGRQDKNGIEIERNLTEYAFRVPMPAHRYFLRTDRQMDQYPRWAPSWLRRIRYDLCLNDVTPNMFMLTEINADLHVLRLNDPIEGFSESLHSRAISRMRQLVSSRMYDEIWAVSQPLVDYARELNPDIQVVMVPNGVSRPLTTNERRPARDKRSAIYLGTISKWVDVDLLERTADLLTDWEFHVFGRNEGTRIRERRNLKCFSPVTREAVPYLLGRYEVGLIPFKDVSNRMRFVERPLKFYEYIGAGLGVASTDAGSLRAGMGELAVYGDTPGEFAKAVSEAAVAGRRRTDKFNQQFVNANSWDRVVERMCVRISKLEAAADGRTNRPEREPQKRLRMLRNGA